MAAARKNVRVAGIDVARAALAPQVQGDVLVHAGVEHPGCLGDQSAHALARIVASGRIMPWRLTTHNVLPSVDHGETKDHSPSFPRPI